MNNVFYSTCFLGSVFHLFSTKNMPVSQLPIHLLHCAACRWDCSDHGGFAGLRGNTESHLGTARFGAHQENFQFLEPFRNHWALHASFFSLANNQCWAMRSGPWILSSLSCPHLCVSSHYTWLWDNGLTGTGWVLWSSFQQYWVSLDIRRKPWYLAEIVNILQVERVRRGRS